MRIHFSSLSWLILPICGLFSCTNYDAEVSPSKTSAETLRATIVSGPAESDPATKAAFGVVTSSESYAQVVWNAHDQLSVFHSSGSSLYETEQGGETADFTLVSGDAPSGNTILGLSPYSSTASARVADKTIEAVIPAEQHAFSETFDPAALLTAGASSSPSQMAFYNVCSGFRFTLSESSVSSYASIEFRGNDGEKLAGPVTITRVGEREPSAAPSSGSTASVTLLAPEGGSFEKDVHYYILFAPCVFKKGFTLSFKDSSGNELFKRTCTSYVDFQRGIFPSVRGADHPDHLPAIKDGILLSRAGTANCYIVSAPGSYKFPLVRGNEAKTLYGVDHVEVLWETSNEATAPTKGSVIASVASNRKYVFFETPSTLKDGNAVIAAYTDGRIVWSWHIWVCKDYDPEETRQFYPGKPKAMMDRNLGALSANRYSTMANGLFYQWGRKDPFPGVVESYVESGLGTFMATTLGPAPGVVASDVSTGTVAYATEHPQTFISSSQTNKNWMNTANHTLWASSKTLYDPCPAGWKVPEAYVLDGNNNHVASQEAWTEVAFQTSAGRGLYLPLGGTSYVWYPNNGYINADGEIRMAGMYSCYWSCSPNGQAVFALELSQSGSTLSYFPNRYGKARVEGHSVRCIKD